MPASNRNKAIDDIKRAEHHIDKARMYLARTLSIYDEGYPSIAMPIATCMENIELIRDHIGEDDAVLFGLLDNYLLLMKQVLPQIRNKI